MSIYADTSFFVSLYLTDQHTPEVEHRMVPKPPLWLTPLHRAEWTHAIEQHIFQGQLSLREAQRVYADFEHDREVGLWDEVSLPDTAFEVCAELARRHVARLGGRTLDTLHVASALELKAKQFWTFDERQARLAAGGRLEDQLNMASCHSHPAGEQRSEESLFVLLSGLRREMLDTLSRSRQSSAPVI